MRALFLLTFLGFSWCGFGQFGEDQVVTNYINQVEANDFDKDGDNDVFTLQAFSRNIFLSENKGNGNLDSLVMISDFGDNPSLIRHVDVNNDGWIDILAASLTRKEIFWYQNTGSIDFSQKKIIPVEVSSLLDIQSIDLDNDEDQDIVVVANDSILLWLENNGIGDFEQKQTLLNVDYKIGILKLADLNNDRDIDIVLVDIAQDSGSISYYKNSGTETFEEKVVVSDSLDNVSYIEIADFDDNSLNDIVYIAGLRSRKLAFFENLGNDVFSEEKIMDGRFSRLRTLFIDDIDQDNDLDILVSDRLKISWLENLGDGNFSSEIILQQIGAQGLSASTVDLDEDGQKDLLYISAQEGVFWSSDFNNPSPDTIVKHTIDKVGVIEVLDLDEDGILDIVSVVDQKIIWYKGLGNKFFEEQSQILLDVNDNIEDILFADFNNDGRKDLVVAGDSINWYSRTTSGVNYEKADLPSLERGKFIRSDDVNDDGYIDLVVYLRSREIVLLLNSHEGFQLPISLMNDLVGSMYLSDIDSDGDKDIIAYTSPEIICIKNNGESFSSQLDTIISLHYGILMFPIDLDRDSYIDIITESSEGILWHKNDGIGNFEMGKVIFPQRDFFTTLSAFDVEGDGDIDVVTNTFANTFHGDLYWHENDGNENFSSSILRSNITQSQNEIKFVDIDSDLDIDIITPVYNSFFTAYIENLSNNPSIEGINFFDENANSIFDSIDVALGNIKVEIEPNALSTYTSENGIFRFYLENGTYTLTVEPDSCYQLTTDSLSYTITIDGDVALNKNFGFQLASDYQHTQSRINSSATRCGFTVPFWLSVQNDGCVPSQGQYGLVLDDLVTLVETAIEPEEIRGDTLLWNYEQLFSTQNERIRLSFEIAGTDFLGDTIRMTGLSYIETETGELELSSTYDYASEIRCAYDPNDKLVYPNRAGEYDKNYTLFEEELEYTIRFQNTGTDTAFTVVIKDYLDPSLNWKTFKPVLASHPHETLLHPDGLVEFTFKNILLPDSTTNEPLSHGFVTFKIAPNEGLDENTSIENTTDIFFDFNPPITTNTTENVFVSELPKVTTTKDWRANQQRIQVYPNPFRELLTFRLATEAKVQLLLFDATGRLLQQAHFHSDYYELNSVPLAQGLYFYQVLDEAGQVLGSGKVVKE
ncbi:MAG: T9SS type A sorting domain-containing protein [Bacteroidota bacterium]